MYKLQNEIEKDRRKYQWKLLQQKVIGYCMIIGALCIVVAALTSCETIPQEKCETKAESVGETIIGGVLMSQGWGYQRGCL